MHAHSYGIKEASPLVHILILAFYSALAPSSWSALALDGSASYFGVRHPSRFRIGMAAQFKAVASTCTQSVLGFCISTTYPPLTRAATFSSFSLSFGMRSPLGPVMDPAAVVYNTVVGPNGGGAGTPLFGVVAVPAYIPYSFAVAGRDATGVASSAVS